MKNEKPPLYRIKKGKFEQYIKDDREYVSVMVKRALGWHGDQLWR